jgi:D-beta-D-heptose 7-phosphate kinase/D-beta-D-heptose 1-phosphate adenosyltransferase
MTKTPGKLHGRIPRILTPGTHSKERFIPDLKTLGRVVKDLKKRHKKIVLTQGVWDLIHEGHATYLEQAKAHGDILIVGVDSDELTKLRKGPSRPIVPQSERVTMLMHLRHVDIVTIREAHHGIGDLIHVVQPDILITSFSTKDFTDQMKKDYEGICKQIITLPPQATTSTSARIRNLTMSGAEELAEEINGAIKKFIKKIKNS